MQYKTNKHICRQSREGACQFYGGKLWNAFNYRKRNIKKIENVSGNCSEAEDDVADCSSSLEFLKTRIEPFDSVLKHWDATYEFRARFLKEGNSLEKYVKDFPVLNSKKGSELIKRDFEKKYPEKADRLHEKWNKTSKAIIHILKNQKKIGDIDTANSGKF